MKRPLSFGLFTGALLLPVVASGQSPSTKPEAPMPAGPVDPGDDDVEVAPVDPAKKPEAGKGALTGVVRSTDSKGPVEGAQVLVVGTGFRTVTDAQGRYRLELPPGVYELRILHDLHRVQRITRVRVGPGIQVLDTAMRRDDALVEVFEAVEAEPVRASTATQLTLRRNSAAASDAIGAQEIARTPDRNAADTARRVVGASVVDSRYVYVRGLGERYTNALLNGMPLPSPEPDKQAVPLDIFPVVILSDLTILKTFTPDMPGDFAGGSVHIHTRDFPTKFELQATANVGFNTQSTFASRLTLPETGKLDWLGIDGGKRALPGGFPSQRLVDINPNTGDRIDLSPYGRALNSGMGPSRSMSAPSYGGSVVVGDSFALGAGKHHRLGYQAALSYGQTFTRRADETLRTYAPRDGGALQELNAYTAETGITRTQWSLFGNVGWSHRQDHKVTLTGVVTRTGEAEVRQILGFNEERSSDIEDTRLRFASRALAFGQLRGEHRIAALGKGTLTWTGMAARATLDDPDLRNTVFTFDPQSGRRVYEETPLSGLHFFANQAERTLAGSLDYLQPLAEGKRPVSLKAGTMVVRRRRSFDARRFVFRRNPAVDPGAYQTTADGLFTDGNITNGTLRLEEQTRADDAYTADYDVTAGYVMTDVSPVERLRIIAGPRVERSVQTVDSFDQFAPDTRRIQSTLARTDLLPAAAAVLKLGGATNLRLSGTQTVARPQLRELAPFQFSDYFGGRDIQGNPDLDRTTIVNLDSRLEWFPTPGEVLALSVFYKSFRKPIEPVVLQSSRGVITFQNAAGAENLGAELEVRKRLGFLAPKVKWLGDFTGIFNVTFVDSQVELASSAASVQTSDKRPLAGQSPYTLNAALDYDRESSGTRVRLSYNVTGARISQVGAFGLPDVYEQPRHLVDLSAAQRLGRQLDVRGTVSNLLDAPYRFTHGRDGAGALVNRYRVGATAMVLVTFTN